MGASSSQDGSDCAPTKPVLRAFTLPAGVMPTDDDDERPERQSAERLIHPALVEPPPTDDELRVWDEKTPSVPSSVGSGVRAQCLPSVGDSLDGWKIQASVGRGGMSALFLVVPENAPADPLVMKLLLPDKRSNERCVLRLVREGWIGMALQHKNLVEVHGVKTWRGFPYVLMEHVPGQNLNELVTALHQHDVKLGPEHAVSLAVEVLRGLQAAHRFAHSKGREGELVHCDISPDNLLISDKGIVKVIDFGVATFADGTTTYPFFEGKARFAAPEQLRGQPIDQRADIYSIGVLLWRLLTGHRLLDIDAEHVSEVLPAKLLLQPAPPSRLEPSVPPALDKVVLRCLEVEPARRPATVEALERLLLAAVPAAKIVTDHDRVALLQLASRLPVESSELARLGLTRVHRAVATDAVTLPSLGTAKRRREDPTVPVGPRPGSKNLWDDETVRVEPDLVVPLEELPTSIMSRPVAEPESLPVRAWKPSPTPVPGTPSPQFRSERLDVDGPEPSDEEAGASRGLRVQRERTTWVPIRRSSRAPSARLALGLAAAVLVVIIMGVGLANVILSG